MDKDLLRMNLQYFAENDGGADEQGGTDQQGGNQNEAGNDEPQVSVAEMKRRIQKEKDLAQQRINKLENSFNDKIDEAVKKAQAEAELSGKELEKFKQQEAQRELEAIKKENEQLKKERTKRELRDEAINVLSERKLPVNDIVLEFVVKDTADDTLESIDKLAELLKTQREEFAQTDPPITSGGFGQGTNKKTPKQILDGAKITDF